MECVTSLTTTRKGHRWHESHPGPLLRSPRHTRSQRRLLSVRFPPPFFFVVVVNESLLVFLSFHLVRLPSLMDSVLEMQRGTIRDVKLSHSLEKGQMHSGTKRLRQYDDG